MNGTSFAEAQPDILELAQQSLQDFEDAGVALANADDEDDPEVIDSDMHFSATQALLRVGLSIAVDLRRIANALERRHV